MSGATIDPARYEHHDVVPVRRALLSVSDKTGLLDFVAVLVEAGVEIVSTGSTAQAIRDAGHPVIEVAEVTGFPESLDGRVKTLHPAVHAGILADRRLPEHRAQLHELGIAAFDLVVVNLYPFARTVAAGAAPDAIVEQIDIGGPALVRGSAKNHASVAIVVEPALYSRVGDAVRGGGTALALRRLLAAKAFSHVAAYDAGVAAWFTSQIEDVEVAETAGGLRLAVPAGAEAMSGWWSFDATPLRYGENSHQRAALLRDPRGRGLAQATQLHGKEMSYNNFVDADAAVRAAYDFASPAVAIIKHANPCGIAVASKRAPDPIASAHRRAHECDPLSAFGGVIAANRVVTLGMAEQVKEIFTEVIVAPAYEPAALSLLKTKKTLRVLQLPEDFARTGVEYRHLSGGALVQTTDTFEHLDPTAWRLVSGDPADETLLGDLAFAWAACRAVKSNAILLAQGGASVGVGMGQVNRVDSCHLAVSRAGDRAAGSVAASDAFFPFADGLQVLIDAGVRAVVQPGGSVRDEEVVQAAASAGLTMYFTGERHFFH